MEHAEPTDRQSPERHDEKRIKIRASVFFDGTLDNHVNTSVRVAHPHAYRILGFTAPPDVDAAADGGADA